MPAAVAVPLITGAITGGTQIVGAKLASNANKRAIAAQTASNDAQLAYLREQSAADERRYLAQQEMERRQWEAQQAQRAPYRALSQALLSRYYPGMLGGSTLMQGPSVQPRLSQYLQGGR